MSPLGITETTDDISCFYLFCFCLGCSKYSGGEKKGELKEGRITPLDHTHHGGLVLWLTLITRLQQVIPFPITLQQAKAVAVTLSLLLLQSCPHSLQVAEVQFGKSVLINSRAWGGEHWFWTPGYLHCLNFHFVFWVLDHFSYLCLQDNLLPSHQHTGWASRSHMTSEPRPAHRVCRPREDKSMAKHPIYCLPDGPLVMWWSLIAGVLFAPVTDTAALLLLRTSRNEWQLCLTEDAASKISKDIQFNHF